MDSRDAANAYRSASLRTFWACKGNMSKANTNRMHSRVIALIFMIIHGLFAIRVHNKTVACLVVAFFLLNMNFRELAMNYHN